MKTAIVDGEAVVLDDKGRSDFGMLQRALGRLPSAVEAGAIVFFAFDLLYLDGRDLRRVPLRERRRLLEPLVAGREGAVRLSEKVQADGDEFFRVACEQDSKASSPSTLRSPTAPAVASGGRRSPASAGIAS